VPFAVGILERLVPYGYGKAADLQNRSALHDPLALWELAGKKKGLDQLAIAADGHPGKGLIPGAFRDLRFRVEPASEQFELGGRDFTLLDVVEKMLEQSGRNMVPSYLRHGLPRH
jgi:hypothetical protein